MPMRKKFRLIVFVCVISLFVACDTYTVVKQPTPISGKDICSGYVKAAARSRVPPRTIIAGAGYAGIAAANELASHGIDFLIVEASDRIGGRMKKFEFGTDPKTNVPYTLEAGANWIEGTLRNPVWTEKIKFGLLGQNELWTQVTVYDENGVPDPHPYANGTAGWFSDIAFDGAGQISTVCLKPGAGAILTPSQLAFCQSIFGPSYTGPVNGDDCSNAEAETLFKGFVANTPLKRVYQLYHEDYEWAQMPQVTSVNNTLPMSSYTDFKDAALFVLDNRGYEWLVKKLGGEFLKTTVNNNKSVVFNDARLMLQTKVTKVEWSPTDPNATVTVHLCKTMRVEATDRLPVRFPCISGTETNETAGFFVPTFSLGVLHQTLADEASPPPPISACRFSSTIRATDIVVASYG